MGRNYDWTTSYGETVILTPIGYKPHLSPFGAIKDLKHACIGMGISVKGTPLYFDVYGDQGLACAGLNFSHYCAFASRPEEGKTNIAPFEFPLWVVSQFEKIDDVEEALKNVVLVDESFPGMQNSPLHWMIGNKTRSIVVESTDTGLHVFHNDVDVLTNQPGYEWHHENLRNYLTLTPHFAPNAEWTDVPLPPFGTGQTTALLPGGTSTSARFVRAAYYNATYPQKESEHENVIRMMHTLGGVEMIEGTACTEDGSNEMTLYSSCYSGKTHTYYWRCYDSFTIEQLCMDEYDMESSHVIVPNVTMYGKRMVKG